MWPLLLGGVNKCGPEWANRFRASVCGLERESGELAGHGACMIDHARIDCF